MVKRCSMKKLILGITAIVISFAFISCPHEPAGPSGNGEPVIPNNPGQKTVVVFDNTYGICTVLVYDDYRRRDMDRIVEIPAGQCSDEIEQTPSTSTPFYFAYRITLKSVSGFFVDFVPEVGKDQKAVRIDANTRTVVPIPVLDEAVSSEQQVLSPKSYLSISNNSNYSFQLHRGVSMIRPDNFPDSGVVNSGERAPYTINTGRSSDFRLLVGADYKPFPESPERFEAGNFYSYQYTNSVSLNTQIPINLDNVDMKTYTVSFNGNGGNGTVPASQTVRLASVITLPLGSGLSNGNRIFGGWSADASGSGVVYSAGTTYTVTGDITLYAKWHPANTTLYTVTFDSAGGNETASQSMVSGALAIRPPDPYRAGYTFGGWYLDTGRQNPYDFTTPVKGSFTLYAKWIANRYTVTFNANGASGAVPAAVTVDYGSSITLPAEGGLSKPDGTFRSWNTEDDGKGTVYASGAQYTVTADVTLFAVWNNILVYEMAFVPDGSFEMGRNLGTGGGSDVTPVHTVTLGGYYMGIFEVTQAQYEAVMWTTIEEQQALAGTNTSNYGRGNDYPMYYVSWYDALVFCNKLSMAEGLSPAYMINNSTDPAVWGSVPASNNAAWNAVTIVSGSTGYRLPTEAQWEYAAKGGNGTTENYTYAGSNNPDDVAWYSGNSSPTTHTIGTKAPNGLGLYDMSGNVSEWCWDWNGSYSSEAQINPDGASLGSDRIVRGGSWSYPDQYSSSVYRFNNNQHIRNNSQGFRLMRPSSYTITFNINGGTGTAPAAQPASLGSITLPDSSGFSKEGYIFGGWNTDADGTGETYSAGSSYTVIGNAALYAKWVNPTITFDINGGSGTTPASQTVSLGSAITLPDSTGFSKSGYILGGWNANADGTGETYSAGSSYTVTDNVTLYAKWVTSYTVTFNLNGGTGTTPTAQTVISGSTITLPGGDGLSKSGYIFGGWNANADGTGETYSAGSSYTVTGNVTLYARWVYPTITFNINGGTGTTPTSQTVSLGSTITLPGGDGFSKSDHFFGGWNTNADGTGTNYSAGSSYTLSGNVTLYAKWLELYTITFNLNGGSGTTPASQTAGSGLTITLPGRGGLSKSGYFFGGWNTNADGTGETYSAVSSYTVTGNVTLYARWTNAVAMTVSTTSEFTSALSEIRNSADSYFIVTATADFSLSPQDLTLAAYCNKSITLRGNVASRTISLSGQGSLFTVGADVELVLEDIVLVGISNNNTSLVKVNTDGILILNSGGKITGNTYNLSTATGGAGVYIDGGTLEITGGEISGNNLITNVSTTLNNTIRGGGVYAVNGSTVFMSGGSIKNNNVSKTHRGWGSSDGGGIALSDSTFEMISGFIEGNTVLDVTSGGDCYAGGGGVHLNRDTIGSSFYFKGGIIRNNSCTATTANMAIAWGGGVAFGEGIVMLMSGGIISGNTCTSSSSDYYNNPYIVGAYGGGVLVMNNSLFVKTGGIIYGDESGDDIDGFPLKNTVRSNSGGYSVFYRGDNATDIRRNTTFRETDDLYCDGSTLVDGRGPVIIVPGTVGVTVAMWDKNGDGWDGSAALRININGTYLSPNARLGSGGGPGYHTFTVNPGDVVRFYWVNGGTYDYECAFAVYYSAASPNPAFNPSSGTTDSGRVLISKQYGSSGSVGNGTLMGEFTVP
jgi:uncharacterized repeat protein (TIGR02543 family)